MMKTLGAPCDQNLAITWNVSGKNANICLSPFVRASKFVRPIAHSRGVVGREANCTELRFTKAHLKKPYVIKATTILNPYI